MKILLQSEWALHVLSFIILYYLILYQIQVYACVCVWMWVCVYVYVVGVMHVYLKEIDWCSMYIELSIFYNLLDIYKNIKDSKIFLSFKRLVPCKFLCHGCWFEFLMSNNFSHLAIIWCCKYFINADVISRKLITIRSRNSTIPEIDS